MTTDAVRAYYRDFKDGAHKAKIDNVKLRRSLAPLAEALRQIQNLSGNDSIKMMIEVKRITRAALAGQEPEEEAAKEE